MAARNDITGDSISTKYNSDSYRNNFDNIFKKKTVGEQLVEAVEETVRIEEENKKIAEEYVTISRHEYESLVDESDFLNCLRLHGVDNWVGYDFAVDEHYSEGEE